MKKSVCVLLILAAAAAGSAQDVPLLWGYRWPAGGSSSAMGGAGTAVPDGQNAFIYNPALLGEVRTTQIYGSFVRTSLTGSTTVLGDAGGETLVNTELTNIGIAVPLPTSRGSLVFGVGYQKMRGYDRSLYGEEFDDSPGDSVTYTLTEMEAGGLGRTALAGAIEVAPNLFLGGSLNFWSGTNDYTLQSSMLDAPFNIWTFSDSTAIDNIYTRLSGVNVTLSGLMKVSPAVILGASIHSPLTLRCREEWTADTYIDWDDGERVYDVSDEGSYTYRVAAPWQFRLGGSARLGPLLLAADIELNDYSSMEYKDEPPYIDLTKTDVNMDIRRNLRNTTDYGFGGELTIPGTEIRVRGGYAVQRSPYKSSEWSKDRTFLTFGAGFRINESLVVNLSYSSTSWSGRVDDAVTRDDVDAGRFIAGFSYDL
ncbi:outer membrane protein transport protein [bacterium]|nr:outer membrane protein transport protein [bacterium]